MGSVLLFNRVVELNIAGTLITDLKINFKVRKDRTAAPNTAEVKIYNLSEETRKLTEDKGAVFSLEAGYEEDIALIHLGTIKKSTSMFNDADYETTIISKDGEKAIRKARVSKSFKPGTTVDTVINTILDAIPDSVNKKAIKNVVAGIKTKGKFSQYTNGKSVYGNAYNLLTNICRDGGYDVSIQDNEIVAVLLNEPVTQEILYFTPDTGLIGSPAIGEKGRITARVLLQPTMRPNMLFSIESNSIKKSTFRADIITHEGDTHDTAWYTTIEGLPI